MERKVLFDILDVSRRNQACLAESAFALAALALEQVAFSLETAKYLPCASDFEALGDGLPCFCFSSDSWHGARKLREPVVLARQKWGEIGVFGRILIFIASGRAGWPRIVVWNARDGM